MHLRAHTSQVIFHMQLARRLNQETESKGIQGFLYTEKTLFSEKCWSDALLELFLPTVVKQKTSHKN